LALAFVVVEVDEFVHVWVGEDVVTPARTPKLEAEGLDVSPHVGKTTRSQRRRERSAREVAVEP
jgi:hypothetical protein